jgi:hypothetical protein
MPSRNIFDKTSSKGYMEEWEDWMRWEGNTTTILNTEDCRASVASSSVSSPDSWSAQFGLSPSYTDDAHFSFEDAPFEIDDTTNTNMFEISNTSSLLPVVLSQGVRRPFHGFSTLTEAEERDLQNLAMPTRAPAKIQVVSQPPSPTTSESLTSPIEEAETTNRKNRKRKSMTEELPSALCQSRKRGHNAIEKRYR